MLFFCISFYFHTHFILFDFICFYVKLFVFICNHLPLDSQQLDSLFSQKIKPPWKKAAWKKHPPVYLIYIMDSPFCRVQIENPRKNGRITYYKNGRENGQGDEKTTFFFWDR